MIKNHLNNLQKSKNYLFLNTRNFILNFIIYYIFKLVIGKSIVLGFIILFVCAIL